MKRAVALLLLLLCSCATAPDPDRARAEMERAERLLAERKRDDARDAFDRAAAFDPRNADLHARIGMRIAEDGDGAGAEPWITRAMELAPHRADLVAQRAWVRGCIMDYQGTIDDCDVALRMDPAMYWVYENRAWAKEILGDNPGAAADLREAIRRAPPGWPRVVELKEHLKTLEK